MKWITGEDLYRRLPSWMADAFYSTIMKDCGLLLEIFSDISSHDFDFEIFMEESQFAAYGVRMYYDNILLREYKSWHGTLDCYFELNISKAIGGNRANMVESLKYIWKRERF